MNSLWTDLQNWLGKVILIPLLFWAANQKNVATSTNDKELLIHIIELFWYLKKSVDWYVINISYRFIEQPLKPNTSDK